MSFTQIGSLRLYLLMGEVAPTTPGTKTEYTIALPEGVGGIKTDVTTEDCEVPTNGILGVEATDIIKAALEYSYKTKKLDMNIMSMLLGGAVPSATPPTTITVGSNFSFKAYCYMEWYRNGDATGTPSRKHSGFQASISADGEFTVDPSKHSEAAFKIKLYGAKGIFA